MPPKQRTIQRVNTPATRSSSRLEMNDIITADSEVKDVVSAKAHLEQTAMAISGKPFSADKLSDILFHITQMPGITLPVQLAIRAVAFLLEETAEAETAEKVAKLVITAISPHIARIQETSEKLDNSQIKIAGLTADLSGGAAAGTMDIDSRLDKVHEAMTTLTSQVKEANQQGNYKGALMKGLENANDLSPEATKRAARNAVKARQVLINIPKDSNLAPNKISHAQLVEKIKEALKALKDSAEEDPPDLDIRAISQFRNGGTIIEFQTPQAAEHLKNKRNRDAFIQALDPNASIKERTYPVIIQFVPLNFNPDNVEQLRDLEKENNWNQESITLARWIKPPTKRNPNQRVAHLLIILNDPKVANESIRDGITLNQNILQVKKNKREPIRCAKCQHYGHIAKECISHQDACANCAGDHRTSECNNKDRTCCVSCESDDHTSWDRKCPEFERRCNTLDAKDQDNTMPYFPTDEPWTQVSAPPKATPYKRTDPPPATQEPRFRTQDTLDHHFNQRGSRPSRGTQHLPRNAGFSARRTSNYRSPTPGAQPNYFQHE